MVETESVIRNTPNRRKGGWAMPPAARVGDMHVCPMQTPGLPPIPHVGGPILPPGCPHVLIGNMPAACMGDSAVCVGPPDVIIKGSSSVLIGGRPAARMGDQTAHGGQIVMGCPTVIIGGSITYWSGSGWRPHRGCDRWVRLRALRASIAASLPGILPPKAFDVIESLLVRLSGRQK